MTLQQPGQMKVWKSPVFYFGVLLVVAVAGLLLAPFVIDWNGYRSDLEAYGKKLTGREVAVEGRISARLFPWPRLTAEKVAIANPPGFAGQRFATAERITIRLSQDVLERFRESGDGWQTKMNDALRDWLTTHTVV